MKFIYFNIWTFSYTRNKIVATNSITIDARSGVYGYRRNIYNTSMRIYLIYIIHMKFECLLDLKIIIITIIYSQEASEEYLQRGGVKFSFILYHRWLLRFLVNRALFTRNSKQGLVNM